MKHYAIHSFDGTSLSVLRQTEDDLNEMWARGYELVTVLRGPQGQGMYGSTQTIYIFRKNYPGGMTA